MPRLEALPIAGALGAELRGLDLSQPLDDASVEAVLEALYEHKVIFFRAQTLTPRQQIDFSAQLAPVFTDHPSYLPTLEGHGEIVVLDGQGGGRANLWHSDVTISPKPPMGAVLYMKRCPDWGGDTLWADMTAAYAALSDRMKTYLEGLHAVHDLSGTIRNIVRDRSQKTKSPTGAMPSGETLPRAIHPVVRTHPVTGRKILYVNPTFTAQLEGLPAAEGDALLAFLFQHQNQPEFQCRWSWQAGDVAIWDNRATQHYAIADYGDAPRTIHRVTLEGEAPGLIRAALCTGRAVHRQESQAMSQLHYRTCHLCETMCGIEVEHDGEKILAIRGDKNDVLSQGNICPKATGLQDIHTDPDRLRRPLKRVRKDPSTKSPDDEWVQVEWEDAFEYVGRQLAGIQREFGMDSIGSYCGRSTAHNIGALLSVDPLRRIVGSKHVYTGSTVDQMPHNFVWHHMLGHQFFGTVPDINRTRYYLMLGTNPKLSNGAMMSTGANTYKKLEEIRARGGKTVLIDPRRTESAPYMDEHHFIRPNTDALFLLGVIQTLFARGLATPGRLGPHIDGWDEIEPMAAQFDMDRISEVTGIARGDIERIAVEFANAESAVCYGRTGVSMVEFGGLCQWLMQVVNIITGNMDEEGGMMFPLTAIDSLSLAGTSWDRYRSRVSGRPEFAGELPMAVMPEEILTPGEGQLRGLIAIAGNPVLSMADGKKTEEALQHLQFMVSVDYYINETTRFADIILPPVGPFEKAHYDLFYHLYDTVNWSKYSPPLFAPEEPAHTDLEILSGILERLAIERTGTPIRKWLYRGLGGLVSRHLTVERVLALGLRFGPYGQGVNPFKTDALSLKKLQDNPHGVFLGHLEKCLPERLFTPDKKIHLAPQVLLDDLPRLRARFFEGGEEALQADSEFDLKIISRLTNRTLGWMHHSPRLVKGKNPCELMIHPEDAAARGIEADSLVRVTSRRSSIELPATISPDVMPGVVCMPHLWGHDRPGTRQRVANATPGVSMNDLTDISVIDELTGNAVVNGVPVRVAAVGKTADITPAHADETVEEFVAS